jgi:NADH-quinone oxidoreductase subunit A
MKEQYIGVVVLFVVALLTAGMFLMVSYVLGPRRRTTAKDAPYESGVEPLGDTRQRFSVKFYLVAVLFIVFDVEVVFLYPWAVVFRKLGLLGLVEALIFLGVLCIGLMYAWRKGALDWD